MSLEIIYIYIFVLFSIPSPPKIISQHKMASKKNEKIQSFQYDRCSAKGGWWLGQMSPFWRRALFAVTGGGQYYNVLDQTLTSGIPWACDWLELLVGRQTTYSLSASLVAYLPGIAYAPLVPEITDAWWRLQRRLSKKVRCNQPGSSHMSGDNIR